MLSMKFAAAVATLLAAPAALLAAPPARPAHVAPAPPPKPLPVFEFMGANTETAATLDATKCPPKADGTASCADYSYPTVAGRPMRWLVRDFNQGKLYRVMASFGTGAFDAVREAFVAKYGPPSSTETRKWQSKAGATFDNVVSTWRFKSGRLELESMGGSVDEGAFTFVSTANSPPAEKPKVDF